MPEIPSDTFAAMSYQDYKVIYKITHVDSPTVFYVRETLQPIKARNIAEVLKKEKKIRNYELDSFMLAPHWNCEVAMIRLINSNFSFIQLDGIWRKFVSDFCPTPNLGI